jgi:hypothetical protein
MFKAFKAVLTPFFLVLSQCLRRLHALEVVNTNRMDYNVIKTIPPMWGNARSIPDIAQGLED